MSVEIIEHAGVRYAEILRADATSPESRFNDLCSCLAFVRRRVARVVDCYFIALRE